MTVPSPSPTPSTVLPKLRRDVTIEPLGPDQDGMPVATIIDPVRATYFRIEWPESALLPLWQTCSTVPELCQRASSELGLTLTSQDIETVSGFLQQNQLTVTDPKGGWQRYHAMAEASKHGVLHSLVHNYLFFRIPLLHPQAILTAMQPRFEFLFSRAFMVLFIALVLAGAYLTSRQSDAFLAMFSQTQNLPSLAVFAVVLLALKLVHELGHAIMTVRAGCRVPSMGIAFMLGAPVLYTDTTDSWRLARRRDRLGVVVAGVGAEMIVAGIALFLWPFLTDGLARQICFAIMTTSLVTTVLINLNPFMRYDGYFALSDYLEVPNLQPRSFALANWKMRELLFGLGRVPPEQFAPRLEKILIAYAWSTWIYRLFLFVGIAIIVYAMSFKVLGIVLGLVEIFVFIARPIYSELKEWWAMRASIFERAKFQKFGFAITAVAFALFWPWLTSVDAPALLIAGNEEPLHVAEPARISAIHVSEGQDVSEGSILFEAHSPDITTKLIRAKLELKSLESQAAKLTALDDAEHQRLVIDTDIKRAREQVAALVKLQQRLVVRAPFNGTIVDLDRNLHPGIWQSPDRPLAMIVATDKTRARAVIRDTDLSRIAVNAEATFIPDDTGADTLPMTLASIAAARDSKLPELALADINGGTVETVDNDGETVARYGSFEVSLVAGTAAPPAAMRGTVRIAATATSPFVLAWRQAARVLVREQGF